MKKFSKSKLVIITLDIIIIILGVVFLISGIKDAVNTYNKYKMTDEKKFSGIYNLNIKDVKYKYLSIKDAKLNIHNNITLLVGNSTDPWTRVLVKPLNDIYKEKNKTIYYLELNDDLKKTNEYKDFLKILKVKSLTTPSIIISNNGKSSIYTKNDIINADYDDIPLNYFTDENINKLKELINN